LRHPFSEDHAMRALVSLMLALALASCATMDSDPTAGLEGADVSSRMVDGDRVDEYRVQGQLQVVKVTPKRGAPYYLIDKNGDGRLDSSEGEGPVSPVMWKIFQWN
jgi:hypothetical protein